MLGRSSRRSIAERPGSASARELADVLVIDDSEIARKSMRDALRKERIEVLELPSPIGATRVILRHRVRLVILDVHMPSIRGDRVAALFRRNRRLDGLKLILVSGAAESELEALGESAGADDVVSKSEGIPRLVQTVLDLLKTGT